MNRDVLFIQKYIAKPTVTSFILVNLKTIELNQFDRCLRIYDNNIVIKVQEPVDYDHFIDHFDLLFTFPNIYIYIEREREREIDR